MAHKKPFKSIVEPQVVYVFLVHELLLVSVVFLNKLLYSSAKSLDELIGIVGKSFIHWDSEWYLRIVEKGYNQQSAAFFPLYPVLIKLLSFLKIDPSVGGIIISNLALLISCILIYKLSRLDFEHSVALDALWYMLLFPTSFYFSILYSESLFLMLVLLSFWAARRQFWLVSGLSAALAGLTRNIGVFLVFPIAYEYLASNEFKFRELGIKPLWLSIIPLGIFTYMGFLWLHLGDPFAFATAQKFWHRSFSFPWQAVSYAVTNVADNYFRGRNFLDLLFTAFTWLTALFSYGKIRVSYWMFLVIGLLVPLWAASPQAGLFSMPRFVLILFPIYLLLALRIRSDFARTSMIAAFSGLFVYLSVMFSNSRWVA